MKSLTPAETETKSSQIAEGNTCQLSVPSPAHPGTLPTTNQENRTGYGAA